MDGQDSSFNFVIQWWRRDLVADHTTGEEPNDYLTYILSI